MPSEGFHTIQMFGIGSYGTAYSSSVISFEVDLIPDKEPPNGGGNDLLMWIILIAALVGIIIPASFGVYKYRDKIKLVLKRVKESEIVETGISFIPILDKVMDLSHEALGLKEDGNLKLAVKKFLKVY